MNPTNEPTPEPTGTTYLHGLPGAATALPHSLESEAHLLACLMIDGPAVMAHCETRKLTASAFYDPKHGVVFEVLRDLYRGSLPMEVAVVAQELRNRQQLDTVGGYGFLLDVSSRVPTTAQAKFWIENVRDFAAMRQTIRELSEGIDQTRAVTGGGVELAQVLEGKQDWIANALDWLRAGEATLIEMAAAAYARTMAAVAGNVDKSRWIFTGLRGFDDKFGPFDANNEDWLVVVGAYQGGAKSSFLRQITLHNLRAGKSALLFLLETGIGKFLEQMACTAAGVNAQMLGELPKDKQRELTAALDEMHGYVGKTLFLCDEVIPVETLTARVANHNRRWGAPDFVGVDHMHLLRSTRNFKAREPEMGYIAKELAKCFKRHNRTGLVLAQLNRSARTDGGNRRPASHDVRDSGEIEQAARRVVLLHTPDKDMRGADQTANQSQVMMEIVQAKHNNGRIGHFEFWFRRDLTRFTDVHATELPTPPVSGVSSGGASRAEAKKAGK